MISQSRVAGALSREKRLYLEIYIFISKRLCLPLHVLGVNDTIAPYQFARLPDLPLGYLLFSKIFEETVFIRSKLVKLSPL